jgi:hypothetical protein
MKPAGKRSAGNPHAAFDAAGAGNTSYGGTRNPLYKPKGYRSETPYLWLRAPALDPTTEGFDTADLKDARTLLEELEG